MGTMLMMGVGSGAISAGGGGAFDASTYGTLLGWYDLSDTTKVQDNLGASVTNGGSIDRVVDKGPGAKDARQTDGTKRPVLVTNAKNGLQVAEFDGVNDFFGLPSSRDISKNKAGITVAVVHKNTDLSANRDLLKILDNASNARVEVGFVTTQWYLDGNRVDGTTGGDRYSGGGTLYTVDTWEIVVARFDWANALSKLISSGTAKIASGSWMTAGNSSNTDSQEDPTIGSGGPYGAKLFKGQIGEVIIYDGALSDGIIDSLETALGTKWGITVV